MSVFISINTVCVAQTIPHGDWVVLPNIIIPSLFFTVMASNYLFSIPTCTLYLQRENVMRLNEKDYEILRLGRTCMKHWADMAVLYMKISSMHDRVYHTVVSFPDPHM